MNTILSQLFYTYEPLFFLYEKNFEIIRFKSYFIGVNESSRKEGSPFDAHTTEVEPEATPAQLSALSPIFPNYLDRRHAVALPGHVIVLDLFQLKIIHSKKPGDSFKAMITVDLATAEIIAHAVFRIPKALKGEVPAHKLIVFLQDAFKKRTFCQDFIIHTDRGTQFTSHEWFTFVKQLGAIGSMSDFATPKDNAVAERTIRTIKNQLLKCHAHWPAKVKSLRQIQLVFYQRVAYYNNEFRPKRACGATPVEFRPALNALEHLAPSRVIAHSNHDVNHKAVTDFKQQAAQSLLLLYASNYT